MSSLFLVLLSLSSGIIEVDMITVADMRTRVATTTVEAMTDAAVEIRGTTEAATSITTG